MRTPQWVYDNLTCIVLSYVENNPGIWTARPCRSINGLPETESSVIHCGLCADYANPRKRERAAQYAAAKKQLFEKAQNPGLWAVSCKMKNAAGVLGAHPALPGLSPQYQLHPPCGAIRLR